MGQSDSTLRGLPVGPCNQGPDCSVGQTGDTRPTADTAPFGDCDAVVAPNDEARIVSDFIGKMVDNSEPLDPEYNKFIDEHFWELIGE